MSQELKAIKKFSIIRRWFIAQSRANELKAAFPNERKNVICDDLRHCRRRRFHQFPFLMYVSSDSDNNLMDCFEHCSTSDKCSLKTFEQTLSAQESINNKFTCCKQINWINELLCVSFYCSDISHLYSIFYSTISHSKRKRMLTISQANNI
jgi:hypothetical protein